MDRRFRYDPHMKSTRSPFQHLITTLILPQDFMTRMEEVFDRHPVWQSAGPDIKSQAVEVRALGVPGTRTTHVHHQTHLHHRHWKNT